MVIKLNVGWFNDTHMRRLHFFHLFAQFFPLESQSCKFFLMTFLNFRTGNGRNQEIVRFGISVLF
jgi:hypothetical protein